MALTHPDLRLNTKRCLTLDVVKAVAAAAEAEAISNNWKVSIAIVDDGANLLFLERLDGAQISSADVAQGKATTAMRYKRPSRALEEAVAGGRMAARSIHHLITTGKIPLPGNLHRRVNPKSILKGISLAPGPPRVTLKELPVAVRSRSFAEEVVATLTDRQAHMEAQRCLQCGTCCFELPKVRPPAGGQVGRSIIGLSGVKGTDMRS